jgi:hypothetical protein
MLKVTPRGRLEGLRALSAQEVRALRDAFGRWPEPGARSAGAAVVRAYQHLAAGTWFLCDCLTTSPPSALVPVLESHIRRHHDGIILARNNSMLARAMSPKLRRQ